MIKTIIFDFNGTLLDDLIINHQIFNMLADDFNVNKISLEEYREVFNFPVKKIYGEMGFDVSEENFPIIADRFHTYYNKLVFDNCKIFDSAIEVLNCLKNKYHLVCLSATKKDTLDMQLKHYGIYDYFDEVVGMSDKFAHGKIDLALGWLNNSKLNPEEILFIGDTIHDNEVATSMKVNKLLVSTGHNSRRKLESTGTIVIDDLREIYNYLK